MSDNPEHTRVSLSVDPHAAGIGPTGAEIPPFCVVVLGDFGARAHRADAPATALAERRPFPVRSVEDVLERLRPTLDFELEGPGRVRIEVRELEDLHPDRLVARVPHLRALVESIEPTVTGYRDAQPSSADVTHGGADEHPPVPDPPPSGLLDEIVEAAPRAPERAAPGSIQALQSWIRSVVSPHLEGRESEGQEALRTRLGDEAAVQLRRVLQATPVRAYEGLLRSLLLLLASADPSSGVRVHVLDLTRAELEADLASGLERSAVLHALTEPLSGPCGRAVPALLLGAFSFGPDVRDLALLNRVAMMAHLLGAAWISSARPGVVGARTFAELSDPFSELAEPPELWQGLRESEAAGAVGLAAPPFLARMPYGESTDPCDLEGFEEVVDGGERRISLRYVWGNPAFVCAAALAGSFAARGWNLAVEGPADFGARPFHALPDGAVGAHPLRVPWTALVAERVRARGVMPLVTYRGEARIRVPWIGSIAATRGPLQAWWSPR